MNFRPTAGADIGSTLVKLALRDHAGDTAHEMHSRHELDAVIERLVRFAPEHVGLTGGGAGEVAWRLSSKVASDTVVFKTLGEFDAWAVGARELLARDEQRFPEFLLVSVGTGTSAMHVTPDRVERVGGTALGGGTLAGLGAVLTGARDFAALRALAAQGERGNVDLQISDIYPDGDFLLPGEVNASSFAKLARPGAAVASPADLAHAIMGLVGENVALLCGALARAHGLEDIVFGGSSLRQNPTLTEILRVVTLVSGARPHLLRDGEFAGALGALALAAPAATRPDGSG